MSFFQFINSWEKNCIQTEESPNLIKFGNHSSLFCTSKLFPSLKLLFVVYQFFFSISVWQHPYVNVFKHFNLQSWKKSTKEGEVSTVMVRFYKFSIITTWWIKKIDINLSLLFWYARCTCIILFSSFGRNNIFVLHDDTNVNNYYLKSSVVQYRRHEIFSLYWTSI